MRHTMLFFVFLAVSWQACAGGTGTSMPALSDESMSEVTGAEGIMLELKLRNNVDGAFAPVGCSAVVGTPNPCRMGLEFAARNGIWLMLKEFYGTLHLKDVRLDAATLPETNTSYNNPARFVDTNGTCLFGGTCNPDGDPAILATYPAADVQGTYDDLLSFLNIGRVWLEFDVASPYVPGYNRDTTLDSALSIRMADSGALHSPARMRFWGNAYVFGF